MRDIKNILKQYNKNNKIKVLDFKYQPLVLNGVIKIKRYFLYLENDIHLAMRVSNFERGVNEVIGLENEKPFNYRPWQDRKDKSILSLLKLNKIEDCPELTEFKQIIKDNNIVF